MADIETDERIQILNEEERRKGPVMVRGAQLYQEDVEGGQGDFASTDVLEIDFWGNRTYFMRDLVRHDTFHLICGKYAGSAEQRLTKAGARPLDITGTSEAGDLREALYVRHDKKEVSDLLSGLAKKLSEKDMNPRE